MSESINDQITAITERSMAESDERRDEIVRLKMANVRAWEQKSDFWSRIACWVAVIAAAGMAVTLMLLLLGSA